ncbi:TPR-like protein [Auriscalpium vulgare]|uniref:TPR-like protein n=1 Tax=Auriscalpium vulgare TaxID=40419 RepID=A0ACB8R9L3_9AGAM|nr:TPR-like protein [Auriscalpium vulgare]
MFLKKKHAISKPQRVLLTMSTSAGMLKEISDIATKLPMIKGTAGILLRVLEVRDEVVVFKQRWQEVLNRVDEFGAIICDIDNYHRGKKLDIPHDIEVILDGLKRDVRTIEPLLSMCRSHSMWSRFKLHVNRADMIKRIDQFDQQMNHMSMILSISHNLQEIQGHRMTFNGNIPAKPGSLLGRENYIKSAMTAILSNLHRPARISIMGPGGIGKTSLALTILHDDAITQVFKDKIYFVSCEYCTSLDTLVANLCSVLICDSYETSISEEIMLQHLEEQSNCLLCLDNFESVWDCNAAEKHAIEAFIAKIASLSSVTLIITVRGIEYPPGIAWTDPKLPPLEPVNFEIAKQIFYKICSHWDSWAEKLVQEVEGLPLAVTLIGHLAQSMSCQQLWQEWEKEKTASIGRGTGHRLTSLEMSIKLSVNNQRIQSNPTCVFLLTVISQLPAGLHLEQTNELQAIFPEATNLIGSIIPLQQCSLAYISNQRIQMHPLVRYFCQEHLALPESKQSVFEEYYINMTNKVEENGQSVSLEKLQEHKNIHSVLLKIVMKKCPGYDILCAVCIYSTYASQELGILSNDLFFAIDKYKDDLDPYSKAYYLSRWASALKDMARLSEAERKYHDALYYAIIGKNRDCEAESLYGLGEVASGAKDFKAAYSYFSEALDVERLVGRRVQQAHILGKLSNLAMNMNNLKEAINLTHACLRLSQSLDDKSVQGRAFICLGDISLVQGKYQDSCDNYHKAYIMSLQANSSASQGLILERLGRAYNGLQQYTTAQDYLEKALAIQRTLNAPVQEIDTLHSLGDVCLNMNNLTGALDYFQEAYAKTVKGQVSYQHGQTLSSLAAVCKAKGAYNEGICYAKEALEIHEGMPVNAAHDSDLLARLYWETDELDRAEFYWTQAAGLYNEAGAIHHIPRCILSLAQLYEYTGEAEVAVSHYNRAIHICSENNFLHDHITALQMLGNFYEKRNKIEDTIDCFMCCAIVAEQEKIYILE